MLASAPSRIFNLLISYARKDGAILAQRLQSDLTKKAWTLGSIRSAPTKRAWTKEIETALDRAQYMLVLRTRGSYAFEICRCEQLRALRKGTCVIPIKAQSDTDIPLESGSRELSRLQ